MKKEIKVLGKPSKADRCCFTCRHAHLVTSSVNNPLLCECQVTWDEEYRVGIFHRIPRVKQYVCDSWEEDNKPKQIYPLTPNPNKNRDRFANP